MPLNGDNWWNDKPAPKPKVYTVVRPPTTRFIFKPPTGSSRFNPTAPIFRGSNKPAPTPFWKTDGFKSFVAKLTAPPTQYNRFNRPPIKPIVKTGSPTPGGNLRVPATSRQSNPVTRLEGYRAPLANLDATTTVKVPQGRGGTLVDKVVPVYRPEPGNGPLYNRDETAGPIVNADRTVYITAIGESYGDERTLQPLTLSPQKQKERLDLVNQGRALGWSDEKINKGLSWYDHLGNPQNIPILDWMGVIESEWASNPDNETPITAAIKAVTESFISTGEYLTTNFGWRTPWRVNPDTKKVELRSPIRIGDANNLLERMNDIKSRTASSWEEYAANRNTMLSPEEGAKQLSNLEEWFPEAKKDYQHVIESRMLMDKAWAHVGEVWNEAYASAGEIKPVGYTDPLGLARIGDALATNVNELSPTELRAREVEMKAAAVKASQLMTVLSSGVNYVDPPQVTIARIEAERARRLKTNEGSLDYVMIGMELRAQDVADAKAAAAPLTQEQQTQVWEDAIKSKALEQAIRYSNQDMAFTMEGNPYYKATWNREPWRRDAAFRALAEAELQAGRPLTKIEMRNVMNRFANAGTEMVAESVVDITNFIEIGAITDSIPFFKQLKEVGGLFAPIKSAVKKGVEAIPVVGWFFREANISVANRWAGVINDAMNKVIPSFGGDVAKKLLPGLAERLKLTIGYADSGVRKVFDEMTDPTSAKYIRGSENVSYSEFYVMRELANETGGGIDPAKWGDLYDKALEDAQRQIEYKISHTVTQRNPNKSEVEINRLIKSALDNGLNSKSYFELANEYFSKNFSNSFLSGHRITIDATGRASMLLDDTIFGQFIQKLRLMSDEVVNVPRLEDLTKKVELDADTRAIRKSSMTETEKAKAWADLHGAVKMRTLSLGDRIDKMILEVGSKWGKGAQASAAHTADFFESVHWGLNRAYQAWAMAVLSMNPRWFIQNLVDSTARTIPFGGNPLEDISMLQFGTHHHLTDAMGVHPIALGQSLARNGIDTSYSVAHRYLNEGWTPAYGPFSWFKYEYDRIAREGVTNMNDVPPAVAKLFSAQVPNSKVGNYMKSLFGGVGNALAAIPGAASDFNTAVEFTVRLRMFSREYFKLYDEFNDVFKNLGTENLTPVVRDLTDKIWKAAGGNPSHISAIVDDLIGGLHKVGGHKLTSAERTAKSWSMLFNDDVDKSLKYLSPSEKATFLADVADRFNGLRSSKLANGSDMSEADVLKFTGKYRKGMQDEIQARISQTNNTIRTMQDGFSNPSRVPDYPTMDDIVNHDGTPIKPVPERKSTPPVRKTPNTSVRQIMDNIASLFSPPPKSESVKAAADLKYARGKAVLKSFESAMSEYGKVNVVKGSGVSVILQDGEILINMGEELIYKTQSKLTSAMTDAVIRTIGLRDADVFAHRMDLETYVSKFKEMIADATRLADTDHLNFYTIGAQLIQDTHLRKIIENLNSKIPIESASRLLKKGNVSYSDVMTSEWRNMADELNDLNNRTPAFVKLAGDMKADTTLKLWSKLGEANPLVSEELAFFLTKTGAADNQLWHYMTFYYPGPRNAKGKFIPKAWDKFWNLKSHTYEAAAERNRFLLDLLENSPSEAKQFLADFNKDFARNYLDSVGFKNIVMSEDGQMVVKFDIRVGDRMTEIHQNYLVNNLSSYFFSDVAKLAYSPNKTIAIDTTRLLEPGMDAFNQIKDAFHLTFGLTEEQANSVARVTMNRVKELSSRSGESIEDVLANRLAFTKVEGKLSAGAGVSMAKSLNVDGTGRFMFYGYGSKNFNGVISQLAQMHYTDLVYLAGKGDVQAVTDLRAINKVVEKLDFEIDGVKRGSLLSNEQAKILSDVYAEWVKTGITEQPKLKVAFRHMSELVGNTYQNLAKNVNVLDEGVDASTFNLLDRAFHSAPATPPKSNSFLIRSMANKNGLPSKADDLLAMINAHPSVVGMNQQQHSLLIQSMMDTGLDKETANFTYDLLRHMSASMSPKGEPEKWLQTFEIVKGEEIDFLALAKAMDDNPLFALGYDNSQLDWMVESIFRSTSNKTERATNLRTLLTDASPQERLHLLVKIANKDEPLAKEMAKYLTDNKKLFQTASTLTEKAPGFKPWFEGSAVVDDTGKPKVMYHGSSNVDFEVLDPAKIASENLYGPGFYFTDNPEIASSYSSKGVVNGVDIKLSRTPTNSEIEKLFGDWPDMSTYKSNQDIRFYKNDVVIGIPEDEISQLNAKKAYLKGILKKYDFEPDMLAKASTSYAGVWKEMADRLSSIGVSVEPTVKRGVLPVYMSIKNPFDIEKIYTREEVIKLFKSDIVDDLGKDVVAMLDKWAANGKSGMPLGHLKGIDLSTDTFSGQVLFDALDELFSFDGPEEITKALQASGFDGITHVGGKVTGGQEHRVFIAFEPTQVKSIYNSGAFGPNNPNMLYQLGYNKDQINTMVDMIFRSESNTDSRMSNLRQLLNDANAEEKKQILERVASKGTGIEKSLYQTGGNGNGIGKSSPLTKEAEELLKSASAEGAMPAFITSNLKRIAKENGVDVTDTMTASDVVEAIRNKAKFAPASEVKKGAYWMEGGKRYVALFQDADITTAPHEFAHAALDELQKANDWRIKEIERYTGIERGQFGELQKTFKENDGIQEWAKQAKSNPFYAGVHTPAEIDEIAKTSQAKADLYRAAHEKFANAHIHFLKTQEAPTPQLKTIFEWFKERIGAIWESIKGDMPDLDEGIIKVFDSIYSTKVKKVKVPRRYSSLGDVPLEVAEKVLGETQAARFSNELNQAFKTWKLGQESMMGLPDEATETYEVFRQFLKSKIDDSTGEIEDEFRTLQWQLEEFAKKVGENHYGDELMESLTPTIPDTHIGAGVRSAIHHNTDNVRVYNSMLTALDEMEKDWVRRTRGGSILPLLSKTEADALREYSTKAARNKADMVNMIVNGGEVKNAAGKIVARSDGALPRTNKVLLDYGTRSNFDQVMKMFFPFWMFPSRTLPFWAETLVTHPGITSLYFKIKRASETQRYQAGAIDSQGRPMTSLNGYVKLPGTDLWFNPLAPFSFRYLLDLYKFVDNTRYTTPESEETLSGLPYVVKEFMQNAPLIGFNVAPWTGYLLKKALNIPDGILPGWSIMPQLNLIPKHEVKPYIEGLKKGGNISQWFGDFATYWMFPEPNWQDSLIEKKIIENVTEYANDNPNMSEAEWATLKKQANEAIAKKGDNPLWLKTYEEVTQDDATRNFASFFTGVFTKTFTDGQADLIKIKLDNKARLEAMNNAAVAAALGLPTDDQSRWNTNQARKNADTPEAWAARIYSDVGWVKNDKGQVVNDPAERAKLLALQMEATEASRAMYFEFIRLRTERDAELAKLPVGSPGELSSPVWENYFTEVDKLRANTKAYQSLFTNKPTSLIEDDLRADWWGFVKQTMPTYDAEKQTSAEYRLKYDEWLLNLPVRGEQLKKVFQLRIDSQFGALKPDQTITFNKNILNELLAQTNAEGYLTYKRENDTVWDAANEAWKINHWDVYWKAVEGKEGTEREYAEWQFTVSHPTPNAMQVSKWVEELYGNRFSQSEIRQLMGEEPALSIEDRMNVNRSEEEKYKDTIWMLLSWAGGSTGKGSLDKAYQLAGGEAGTIDTFYDTSGYGYDHNPAKLKQFAELLEQAAVNLKLGPPKGAEFRQRLEVEDLNYKFKIKVARELGEDFLRQGDPANGIPNGIYPRYLGVDYDIQALYKKDYPEDYKKIQQYKTMRAQYARENPLWAQYYVDYIKAKNLNLPVVKPTSRPASPYSSNSVGAPPSAPRAGEMPNDGQLPVDTLSGSSFVPEREVSRLSMVSWPKGFAKTVGMDIVSEIDNLYKNGVWLSKPAKEFLYDLAKRHREWRGFIYGVLSK